MSTPDAWLLQQLCSVEPSSAATASSRCCCSGAAWPAQASCLPYNLHTVVLSSCCDCCAALHNVGAKQAAALAFLCHGISVEICHDPNAVITLCRLQQLWYGGLFWIWMVQSTSTFCASVASVWLIAQQPLLLCAAAWPVVGSLVTTYVGHASMILVACCFSHLHLQGAFAVACCCLQNLPCHVPCL